MRAKIKKIFSIVAVLCVILVSIKPVQVQAKTSELYTSLIQKSNDMYEYYTESGMAVAYKVKLNKNTIVIYGSMSDYAETDKISRHTYKLAKSVKFASGGVTAEDQKMSKSEFRDYLKKVNDSCLSLVLEFKNNKVVRVVISS